MAWLFIITAIIYILISKHITKRWLNLMSIFNALWLFIVLLYQLHLSYLQPELSDATYLTLTASNTAYSTIYFIYYIFSRKRKPKQNNSIINQSTILSSFIIWLTVEIVEIIYSGGLPIFWNLFHTGKTYFDFGIPTLHGLMNAFGLVIIITSYYLYLKTKKDIGKKATWLIGIITFILVFYLALITRQVIISAIIEMAVVRICFIDYKKVTKRQIAKIVNIITVLSLVGIIAFGLVGNLRTSYQGFQNVALMKEEHSEFLVGFDWVYMYLTMTIANINNLATIPMPHLGIYPIAKTFLPTVIANGVFKTNSIEIPNYLVTQAFNVSGYFVESYLGYKILGVIIMAAIYGLIAAIISKKYQELPNEKNVLYLAIITQIILLSFFYNHLLYLPSGFQFVIIWGLFKISGKHKHHAK